MPTGLYFGITFARASVIKAEEEGFEPPVPCGTPVFKTGALNQLCHSSSYIKSHLFGTAILLVKITYPIFNALSQ